MTIKSFINEYESFSSAGDTTELMQAIYRKNSSIEIDKTYMPENPVGLGKMKESDFFKILEKVVSNVLKKSDLENFHKTLLIVGSSVGGMAESEQHYFQDKDYNNIDVSHHPISIISDVLNNTFSFQNTRSISTACTSSANALLLAKRLINVGAYKNILVVGADALCYTTVCGFHALGVLSSKPCKPFSNDRDGMNVAEAVAALLVQDKPSSGAIELIGVGASSDAYHITNPDPQAKGAMSAMQKALNDAQLSSEEIDYINAHGTGTVANDKVEGLAIETLFDHVYVSSTKAITGHTLGAAAALEAIISCEVIKRGLIPPQTALTQQENKSLQIPRETQQQTLNYVMSNSFAFGGNNAVIILGRTKI